MDMKLNEKLDAMINKTWLRDGHYYKFLMYENNNGTLKIATDKKIFEFENEKAEKEIKKFLPVHQDAQLMVISKQAANFGTLADVLVDNIKKIQQDENYIPQAKAISSQVSQLINLAKLDMKFAQWKQENG